MMEAKITCPACGTDISVTVKEVKNQNAGKKNTAGERIEMLKKAGYDVSQYFAMQGAEGGEFIGRLVDGTLQIVSDDEVTKMIAENGDINNRSLFRRWVMAQMFRMLADEKYRNLTQQIHDRGYEYSWRQTGDELYAQMKMLRHFDNKSFCERSRWFNKYLVYHMAQDYIAQFDKVVEEAMVHKCKGQPYKRVLGHNMFLYDIHKKRNELKAALEKIEKARNNNDSLYRAFLQFNSVRMTMRRGTQYPGWVQAFKGSGAYYTLQNMIRFHGCGLVDGNVKLGKDRSLKLLEDLAVKHAMNGEGWRMIGILRKVLADNGIDIQKKMNEWRKK